MRWGARTYEQRALMPFGISLLSILRLVYVSELCPLLRSDEMPACETDKPMMDGDW